VRGDLIRILGELKERRDSGKLKFERVIIGDDGHGRSRGGRAELFIDEKIGNYYLLDSVITMVDAKQRLETARRVPRGPGAGRLRRRDTHVQDRPRLRSRAGGLEKAPGEDESAGADQTVHFGNTPIDDILDIRVSI